MRTLRPPSNNKRQTRNVVLDEEIKKYIPIVHKTARSFLRRLPPNVLRDDLIAAGTYGLLESLRRDTCRHGAAFGCYVRIRIRGAIIDELRAQDWLPRRTRQAVSDRTSTGPTEALPCGVVGFDDVPALESSAVMMDEAAVNPLDEAEATSQRRMLEQAVKQLPDRERTVMQLHYFSGVKFKDIGAQLRVSEPRISQLHARALVRLRNILTESSIAA